ncbi:unnamed protein product [Parascedosporium putredinis]|uniref:C2H2-type domain-containing protein n=1 Tax=Parascedosporium putredinis TaxID=1442378 RepID=A0A9P1GXQ3_9PEZI|nr:unnamed protein product [Parascedosporium putredinis]CAI7990039.1 unnamed protein product [Parascedosporium putredinis]
MACPRSCPRSLIRIIFPPAGPARGLTAAVAPEMPKRPRHQLSHKTPSHECQMPGCGRKFHRKDLLDRHEQKHNGRADAYGRPLSQGRQTFGNNYVFPTSLSHQLPVIQHQSIHPHENPLHLVGYSDVQAPRRPNLHLKFASPANNHGGLAPCNDAPGIPSSASSTYSTGSDLTRSNRSTARSSSVEWVDPSGFLSPSPIPTSQAGSIELLSPISMDASGSVHASSPPPASTRLSMEAMDYQHQLSYSSPQRIPRISNTAYDKTGALSTNLGYSGGSALLDYSHQQPACSIMPLFQNDSMRMPLRERY